MPCGLSTAGVANVAVTDDDPDKGRSALMSADATRLLAPMITTDAWRDEPLL
jgi:hypothetical protein